MGEVFDIGDWVDKTTGDYSFPGEVVSRFAKRSGAIRYVVEHFDTGLCHIFNEDQLGQLEQEKAAPSPEPEPRVSHWVVSVEVSNHATLSSLTRFIAPGGVLVDNPDKAYAFPDRIAASREVKKYAEEGVNAEGVPVMEPRP